MAVGFQTSLSPLSFLCNFRILATEHTRSFQRKPCTLGSMEQPLHNTENGALLQEQGSAVSQLHIPTAQSNSAAQSTAKDNDRKACPVAPKDAPQIPAWSKFWTDTWMLEVLALTCNLGAFASIIIVLVIYNGKSSPQLPAGVTFNAIISTLATLTKSTLILAIAATLGQHRWIWLRSSKDGCTAHDLQLVDEGLAEDHSAHSKCF